MAEVKVGFQLASSLASKHLLDAQYIKGTYMVVQTQVERDALPVATQNNDGVIIGGSLVYVTELNKLFIYDITGDTPAWTELSLNGGSGSEYLYYDDETEKVYIKDEHDEPVELSQVLGLITRTASLETQVQTLDNKIESNITKYELLENTETYTLNMVYNHVYTCKNAMTSFNIILPKEMKTQIGFLTEVIFKGIINPNNVKINIVKDDSSGVEEFKNLIYYNYGRIENSLDFDVNSNNTIDLIFGYDGINYCCYITQYNKDF